jgi:hypothetical protein
MAISVSVPKDLSKIKTKVALNLTKRQIICFGAGIALAVPMFFITKPLLGTEAGAMICMACLFPFFLLGMYEKNGVPAEKLLYYSIRRKVLRPEIRPRSDKTRFEEEETKKKVRKEIAELERKAAKGGRRTKNSA